MTITEVVPPEDMPLEAKGFDPYTDGVIRTTQVTYRIDPESLVEPIRMRDGSQEWAYLAKMEK